MANLTLWLGEAALTGWQAPRRATPGGQAWYPDAAIEPVLRLRLVFHLALRQAEGFAASVLRLLGRELRVPDCMRAGARRDPGARFPPSDAERLGTGPAAATIARRPSWAK